MAEADDKSAFEEMKAIIKRDYRDGDGRRVVFGCSDPSRIMDVYNGVPAADLVAGTNIVFVPPKPAQEPSN